MSKFWKEKNPWDANRAWAGPNEIQTVYTQPKTNRASWEHDAAYANYKNPYTGFVKEDLNWMKDVGQGPLEYLGTTFFKAKSLLSPSEFIHSEESNESMVRQALKGQRTLRAARAAGFGRTKTQQAMYNNRRGGGRRQGQALYTAFHAKMCVEKKFHDNTTGTVTTSSDTTGLKYSVISGISQGTAATERIGRRIFVWDMFLSGTIQLTEQADNAANNLEMRAMVVVDKQSNGTTPDVNEILETGATADRKVFAFRNLENTARFNILMDKKIVINVQASAANAGVDSYVKRVPFHFSKKWKDGLKVMYESGQGAGTSDKILDNNVWLIVYASGTQGEISVNSRIRYTD